MLQLVQHCLADTEKTENTIKLGAGLIGDLADAFPNGEIKQLLLEPWVLGDLRMKGRLTSDTKRTLRWAREVCSFQFTYLLKLTSSPHLSDGQARYGVGVGRHLCYFFRPLFDLNLVLNLSHATQRIHCPLKEGTRTSHSLTLA